MKAGCLKTCFLQFIARVQFCNWSSSSAISRSVEDKYKLAKNTIIQNYKLAKNTKQNYKKTKTQKFLKVSYIYLKLKRRIQSVSLTDKDSVSSKDRSDISLRGHFKLELWWWQWWWFQNQIIPKWICLLRSKCSPLI